MLLLSHIHTCNMSISSNCTLNLNFIMLHYSSHIEGAVRFRLDDIADKNAPLPRTCPPPEQFEQQMGKVRYIKCIIIIIVCISLQLGISNTTTVVIYDNNANLGMFSAARVWYMFRVSSFTLYYHCTYTMQCNIAIFVRFILP